MKPSRGGRARRSPPGRARRRACRRSRRRCCGSRPRERSRTRRSRSAGARTPHRRDAQPESVWSAETRVPQRFVTGLKPQAIEPADEAGDDERGSSASDVGERGERLAGEDLASPQRAREDHLQRACRRPRWRRCRRRRARSTSCAPKREAKLSTTRASTMPGVAEVVPERRVVRPALLERHHRHEHHRQRAPRRRCRCTCASGRRACAAPSGRR